MPARNLILRVGNMKRFDPGIAFARRFIDRGDGNPTCAQSLVLRFNFPIYRNRQFAAVDRKERQSEARLEATPKLKRDSYYLLGHGRSPG